MIDVDAIRKLCEALADPKTTDYCLRCGESPDSGSHIFKHSYVHPITPLILERTTQLLEAYERMREARDALQSRLDGLCERCQERCDHRPWGVR